MKEAALLLALLVLVGAAGGLVALGRQERARRRLAAALAPWRPAAAPRPQRRAGGPALRPLLERAGRLLGIRPERRAEYRPRWWAVLAAAWGGAWLGAAMLEALLGQAASWLGLGVLAVALPRTAFGALERARMEALLRQFPDALGQVTRSVRVGLPVVVALRNVAEEGPEPTRAEFRAVSDRLLVGMPLDQALLETAMRNGLPEYRFFATALALQARTGGALAATLENLAEVIRRRLALRQRGYALAAEARTSAAILAAIPFVTGAALLLLNPMYGAVLFNTEEGRTALALAGLLMALGLLSMRHLIRSALR
ncbi:type II secretion system F family protein [Roseococcus sp. DSY-14]|uniref:type II secretion system F family protein n=1 Tax=Roseococcus sp. DSY-14 TaxID=3369650 RepID=UPI00387B0047